MNNHIVLVLLRLTHVISGVLWVGAAAMLAAYVIPAAGKGDTGMAYLRELIWARDLPRYLNVLLVLALLSGLAFYARLVVLTHGRWAASRAGLAFGVGGAAALGAAAIATWVAAPAVHRALRLWDEAKGRAPDAAEARRAAGRALGQYARAMRIVAALLGITAAAMAVARYL